MKLKHLRGLKHDLLDNFESVSVLIFAGFLDRLLKNIELTSSVFDRVGIANQRSALAEHPRLATDSL